MAENMELILGCQGHEIVVRFDGDVIEVFSAYAVASLSPNLSVRLLARWNLAVELKGPDRKGRYTLFFTSPSIPAFSVGPLETEPAALEPLLTALQTAGASVTLHGS